MSYLLQLGAWNSVFAVPTALVDRHLKLAGAVQLKALLWVLRHGGEAVGEEALSAALGVSKADVADAMLYWQECGLIVKSESGELVPAGKPEDAPAAQPKPEQPAAPQSAAPSAVLPQRPQKPDPAFVASRIAESSEIAMLMQESQTILGRLINRRSPWTIAYLSCTPSTCSRFTR